MASQSLNDPQVTFATMTDLPNELLIKILRYYVKRPYQAIIFSHINRYLRNFALDFPKLWESIAIESEDPKETNYASIFSTRIKDFESKANMRVVVDSTTPQLRLLPILQRVKECGPTLRTLDIRYKRHIK